jgi:hypothetical protein
MSIAWTTIIIIALLLPGVFTFIGYSTTERFSRDIIKINAVGEIGAAILIAIVVHLIALWILTLCGFSLTEFIQPLIDHENLPASTIAGLVVERLAPYCDLRCRYGVRRDCRGMVDCYGRDTRRFASSRQTQMDLHSDERESRRHRDCARHDNDSGK